MLRPILSLAALLALSSVASPVEGQEWTPSTRQMPAMPRAADLSGDWLSASAGWFRGIEAITGVAAGELQPAGEGRGRDGATLVVRFNHGPMPAVIWLDRNGDGVADIVELYSAGAVALQVIDADYDGQANVIRRYDSSGSLIRQDRL